MNRTEWNRQRYTERRALVSSIKLEQGCTDCGYRGHPAALDFDHREGTEKKFQIGAYVVGNYARLMEEIAKCEVVCANCHRIRTDNRRQY